VTLIETLSTAGQNVRKVMFELFILRRVVKPSTSGALRMMLLERPPLGQSKMKLRRWPNGLSPSGDQFCYGRSTFDDQHVNVPESLRSRLA
jgi:hypothetical protein